VSEPNWLPIARRYLGTTEIPGKTTHPTIRKWLIDLKAWWTDDETPWCGTFVGAVIREAGHPPPKHWYRARAWLDWGLKLSSPRLGAIVVYARGGAGHVGFIVGLDAKGRVMTLGGNQGNSVNVAPFDPARVLGYRWPIHAALVGPAYAPRVESGGVSSRNEV
jgi:uncharacterized protein (TIGR02594 family)